MPHATDHSPRRTKHHHRRYTWPPSIQLIDVSAIRVPLPDIDEDPFAHFVSRLAEDEEQEHIVYSAGILSSDSIQMHAEKAFKFRASIAGRWRAFFSKYTAKIHRRHEKKSMFRSSIQPHTIRTDQTLNRDFALPSVLSGGLSSNSNLSHSVRPTPLVIQNLSQPSRTREQERRRSSSMYHRSWHAPSSNLFPISEGPDEDSDELTRKNYRKN